MSVDADDDIEKLKRTVAARLARKKDEGRPERKMAQKPAFAIFDDSHIQIQCIIIDMSAVGACIGLPRPGDIDFIDPETLPDTLTLDIRDEATEIRCEVAWREDTRLGLRFLSTPQPY